MDYDKTIKELFEDCYNGYRAMPEFFLSMGYEPDKELAFNMFIAGAMALAENLKMSSMDVMIALSKVQYTEFKDSELIEIS